MSRTFSHDLVGVTSVEIPGWPGGASNAMVQELAEQRGITVKIEVGEGERWAFTNHYLPILRFFPDKKPWAQLPMFVQVPTGKSGLIHFVDC